MIRTLTDPPRHEPVSHRAAEEPVEFALSVQGGVVGIVDGTGTVVARVGDEVEFDAFNLTYEEAKEHGGLAEITPACSRPYWAVWETFAAVVAP